MITTSNFNDHVNNKYIEKSKNALNQISESNHTQAFALQLKHSKTGHSYLKALPLSSLGKTQQESDPAAIQEIVDYLAANQTLLFPPLLESNQEKLIPTLVSYSGSLHTTPENPTLQKISSLVELLTLEKELQESVKSQDIAKALSLAKRSIESHHLPVLQCLIEEFGSKLKELFKLDIVSFALDKGNEEAIIHLLDKCPQELRTFLYGGQERENILVIAARRGSPELMGMLFEKIHETTLQLLLSGSLRHINILSESIKADRELVMITILKKCPKDIQPYLFRTQSMEMNPLSRAVIDKPHLVSPFLAACSKTEKEMAYQIGISAKSPFFHAVGKDDIQTAKLLYDECPKELLPTLFEDSRFHSSILQIAASKNNKDMMRYILEKCPTETFIKMITAIKEPDVFKAMVELMPEDRVQELINIDFLMHLSKGKQKIELRTFLMDHIPNPLQVYAHAVLVLALFNREQEDLHSHDTVAEQSFNKPMKVFEESLKKFGEDFLAMFFDDPGMQNSILEFRNILDNFIRSKNGWENLRVATQFLILPLLDPKDIKQLIKGITKGEGHDLLSEEVDIPQSKILRANGAVLRKEAERALPFNEALEYLGEHLIHAIPSGKGAGASKMLKHVQKILQTIPLKSLAYAASQSQLQATLINLHQAFTDTQLTVIIPCLSPANFLTLLQKYPKLNKKTKLLEYATCTQKIALLNQYPLESMHLPHWPSQKRMFEERLDKLSSIEDTSQRLQGITALQKEFVEATQPLHSIGQLSIEIARFSQALKAGDTNPELLIRIKQQQMRAHERLGLKTETKNEIDPHNTYAEYLELKSRIEELLVLPTTDSTPDEYLDEINAELMTNPIIIPKTNKTTKQIEETEMRIDRNTLSKFPKDQKRIRNNKTQYQNPFDRIWYNEEDFKIDVDLRQKIQEYLAKQPKKEK